MLSEFGFDEYAMWAWRWHGKKYSRYYEPGLWTDGKFSTGTPEEYGPDKYSARMLEFIDKKKDTPFFIYYSMALTHDPFEMPPDCEAEATKFLKGNESVKTRNFAGMTYYTDRIVGQFVDKLEEHGLTDNTLILFTADNGTKGDIINQLKTVSVSGGKASMTEQGARVPFIVRWPGKIAAGVPSDKMIGLVDVVPTLNAII
jgi:arylsulfatase A-like enzyme